MRSIQLKYAYLIPIMTLIFLTLYFYTPQTASSIIIGNGTNGPKGMVRIPGDEFIMGSDSNLAKPNEKPAHKVKLSSFWIDQTDVTNAQFAEFVKATGYITTAEKPPEWSAIKAQLLPNTPMPSPKQLVPGAMVFIGTSKPVPLNNPALWWRFVPGANWRHPEGPESHIVGKEDYPVTQVSYTDALAYAKWVGKRLPTEAEWEYAARGGIKQASYAWGNEFKPEGKSMANTFSGDHFPVVCHHAKVGTSKVKSYPPNGYQLYDMAGNVWQWVADWYRVDAFMIQAQNALPIDPTGPSESFDPAHTNSTPLNAPERVIRGGSFLCNENFCASYRPSARRGVDPYNPMAHIGFRCAYK